MKRKISFAFAIMCFITLLTLGNILGVFSSIFALFKNFSLLGSLKIVCRIISILTPVAIAVLLYLNRKRDVKPAAYIILIICGCARLLSEVLNISAIVKSISLMFGSSWYANVLPLCECLSSILFGFLLICVAQSIKSKKPKGATQALVVSIVWIGALMTLVSLLAFSSEIGGGSFTGSLTVILLSLALATLPKTFYDYDNCFFFGGNAVKLLCAIAAALVFVTIVAGGIIGSDDSTRGNCFNCGGDGWDSENNCSCIWCGGDGYASWNP